MALFFIVANFCYAECSAFSQKHLEKCIQRVFENKQYCIDKIEDTKIYIKSENIVPTEQGVLIDLNGFDKVLAPILFSDVGGCFLKDVRPMWSDIMPKERCAMCGRMKELGSCINKDCPNYGK
jgi:hypothetical protein